MKNALSVPFFCVKHSSIRYKVRSVLMLRRKDALMVAL
jgi:hypothetical protein